MEYVLGPLVSLVIPTKNSVRFLGKLLGSIHEQSFSNIEVIVVDGNSTDGSAELSRSSGAKVVNYDPQLPPGKFDAPHRRNLGVSLSTGKYVYYVDADMELPKDLIAEAVEICEQGAAAVIATELSFGVGPWARAKALERSFYVGDDTKEAPRFFLKSVWDEIGGLDVTLGGGGDDWDLYASLKEKGYSVGRTQQVVLHNEGQLRLKSLMRKRFMYGKDALLYLRKRPVTAARSYLPFTGNYIKNYRELLRNPSIFLILIIMRLCEYGAGFAGILISIVQKYRVF